MPLSAPVARAIRAVPTVNTPDVVVQFDSVRLDYAGKKRRTTALDASNFSIRRGEFVAFTGPSGCGKSTILKLISGIIAPTTGNIIISGREIGAVPIRIGISFQNPTLLPWATVRQNVMMPLRIVPPFKDQFRAKKHSEFLDRANALLAQVGLSKFADHYPWQLSGGMMQRASICRALIHDPTLLLLDEPFGALDAFTREELWGILQTLFIRHRPTVLLVTHDLNEAAFLADRIFTDTEPWLYRRRKRRQFCPPQKPGVDEKSRIHLSDLSPSRFDRECTPKRSAGGGATTHPLATRLASLAVMLGLFLAWEAFCRFFAINSFVLPKPTEIVVALITRFPALIPHATQTMTTTMIGFLLGATAGVLLGVLTGISRVAYQIVSPLLVSLSSIPKVALVPIFVMWFGAGSVPAVLTAFISSVFPVVVNVATGVATTEPELEHFMRALQASRREILWFVNLPRALPYFFASLKVAVTLAFVGTVISETVASNRGIGNVILLAASNLDVSLVFAALVLLSALGIALYAIAALLEKRFTSWAHRRDGEVFV